MGLKHIKDKAAAQAKKDKHAKDNKTTEQRLQALERAAGLR